MNATVRRLFPPALILLWFLLLGCIFAAPCALSWADPGDFLVRNTIRLSLLYWLIAVQLMLQNDPFARPCWIMACAAYLVHVGVSFEHAHHWSHGAAFRHVEEASGYGAGIFVSYFFTLLWTLDAAWWWASPKSYESRPLWLGWAIHGFMIFIIINGTMIFENGAIRWVSAVALFALGLFWARNRSWKRSVHLG